MHWLVFINQYTINNVYLPVQYLWRAPVIEILRVYSVAESQVSK